MTRLPNTPAIPRLLPDARLYQVWRVADEGKSLEASFSVLESAVDHIRWMLRNNPMERLTLDILPPVEVQAPCRVCGAEVMVPVGVARFILAGDLQVHHDAKNHWVAPDPLAIVGS